MGYLNDANVDVQYLFVQISNGIFSTRIISANASQTRIGIMTCFTSNGFGGLDWTWYDNNLNRTFRKKLSYITNYYCLADIVVPSGYIAFATIYTAENVPIDHITQIRCERFADTVIRVVAVSNGEFIPSSAVYVNVLITPDN